MREYDVFIPSRLTEVDVWVSNLLRQMSLKFNTDMIIKFENTADIASGMYISGNEKTIIKTSGIKTRKDIFEKQKINFSLISLVILPVISMSAVR